MNFRLEEGEKIIKEGKANRVRFAYIFASGGNLKVTNKRVIFIGHGMNAGFDGNIIINKEDILSYGPAFLNQIQVILKNGKKYKFVIFNKKDWVKAIESSLEEK